MKPPTPEMLEGLKRLRAEFLRFVNWIIVDVVVQPSQDYGCMRPDIGLVLRKFPDGSQKVVIWASQDAEGNGPGWLEVMNGYERPMEDKA